MHLDVRSHAAQRVSLVTANGAPEGFDTLVRVHVTLSCPSCRANRAANGTSPASGCAAGTGVGASRFDYSLQEGWDFLNDD